MLQNFQSSFAAREYWNKASSTSKALSSPLRNRSIASATRNEFGQLRLMVGGHRLMGLPTI